MTASSDQGLTHEPADGRLFDRTGNGWCAEHKNQEDWLQVDLGEEFQVCAVATQGFPTYKQWVTDFNLSHSSDGNIWTSYKDGNGTEVVR